MAANTYYFKFNVIYCKYRQEACDEFIDGADDIREGLFPNMKVKTLLKTGAYVPKEQQIEALLRERWGDTPLLNSLRPKGE